MCMSKWRRSNRDSSHPIARFGSGDYAGGIAYGDQNFLGHNVQVVSAAQIGQSRSFVFAGYRDPLVIGAPLTWGIDGLYRYEQIRFFVNHQRVLQEPTLVGGGEAELGWVLSPHLQALFGFSARLQRVLASEILQPNVTLPAYNPRSGRIFLLVFQIRYDNTIAPEGLRRGIRMLFKDEISDQYWSSQFDYSKFEARTELYGKWAWNYPSLSLRTVFDYRSRVGACRLPKCSGSAARICAAICSMSFTATRWLAHRLKIRWSRCAGFRSRLSNTVSTSRRPLSSTPPRFSSATRVVQRSTCPTSHARSSRTFTPAPAPAFGSSCPVLPSLPLRPTSVTASMFTALRQRYRSRAVSEIGSVAFRDEQGDQLSRKRVGKCRRRSAQ